MEGNGLDVAAIIAEMTLEEKILCVAGTDFMYTKGIPRLGVPALCMADGPHGLRKQTESQDNGIALSEPATAFPTAATVASGWDPRNARRIGAAIAQECVAYNVHLLLGPGVNIKRNPLCGRNFEYFSEDPLLAGAMGAAHVEGVQSEGVGSCVKHFALNNTENDRYMGNSVADQRTIREIYLKPFERTVRQGRPAAIMTAYNMVNGTYCSQNGWLVQDVLRGEWGFPGLAMTDWGGMHDRVAALEASLDLEMPGDTAICRKWIADALADGRLPMEALDAAVRNVLEMVDRLVPDEERNGGAFGVFDRAVHDELAAEVAADCAVLLKNEGALPLVAQGSYAVIGDLFEKMRYQGAGSSMINPTSVTSPKDAFDARGVGYSFARGYAENETDPQPEMILEACELAKRADCDAILVFAGLTDYVESEGADRVSMALPQNQLALIDALADALAESEKPLVVVLFGGSPMEVPFAERVDAILYMALPGQAGGTACARLLFGEACPSGHLAETWPMRYEDVPGHAVFGTRKQELYKEGLMVGYRGYCGRSGAVRYPFGFGLSYTSFEWRDMELAFNPGAEDAVIVSCTVENVGGCAGAATVQLYVAAPRTKVGKPVHELRAFSKVHLAPGQAERVSLRVPLDDLRIFDPESGEWVLEAGAYDFSLCTDALTPLLSMPCTLEGASVQHPIAASYEGLSDEDFAALCGCPGAMAPDAGPLTVESRLTELKRTFMGRILFNAVLGLAAKQQREAERMPEGAERDNRLKGVLFLRRVLESNSLISMSMCAGGVFPYNFAEGIADLANGHLIRGLRKMGSRIA